jgi:enoyl-[acyl-carrier protein] reductase II
MGASGAQLGTMFVCAEESIAHENFKKMFMRGNARDAVTSVQIDKRFPVIPVRALKNSASIEFMDKQREVITKYQAGELEMGAAQLEIEHYWAGALKRAVIDGDVETITIAHWQLEDGFRQGFDEAIKQYEALKSKEGKKVKIIHIPCDQ